MHINTIFLFATCCMVVPLVHSVQYKVRGPPMPPRPSYVPNYIKNKWQMPPRPGPRPHARPIPVQMASYKVPVFARPIKTPPPMIFPSAVWKTPPAVYRPPIEKPFITSPPVTQSYEFQLNNEPAVHIPHIPSIKQIGEKGPIHTIPAPNLSPADKPVQIYEEPIQKPKYQYEKEPEYFQNAISQNSIPHNAFPSSTLLGAQALPLVATPNHQYQVTENSEPNQQLFKNSYIPQKYYAHEPEPNNLFQNVQQYDSKPNNVFQNVQQYEAKPNNVYQNVQQYETKPNNVFQNVRQYEEKPNNAFQKVRQYEVKPNNAYENVQQYEAKPNGNNVNMYTTDLYVTPQQVGTSSNDQLSAQELYQLLNAIPQQQLLDSYGMPLVHQPQLQQHFIQQTQPIAATNYQAMINTPQLLQAESAYFNQIPDAISQQVKDNFKPQFHTFNYVEPGSQSQPRKQFAQSRVTADYSLEPEPPADIPSRNVAQNSQDALAQTQYVQHYFATREDNNVVNKENIIGDNLTKEIKEGSTRGSQILSELTAQDELPSTIFYSSLPNKEAADRLASLQAAGSINSNLRKIKQKDAEMKPDSREQMRIYVPDEEDSYEDMETQASGENHELDKKGSSQGIRIYENTYAEDKSDTKKSDEHADYDYSSEEEVSNAQTETKKQDTSNTNSHQNQVIFGSKLKVKSSNSR